MALNVLARAPTSSCAATAVRWVSLPAASADASALSCRNGLMIRLENAEANPSATRSAIRLAAAPQVRREITLDKTKSVGKPTDTSHGASAMAADPVMRWTRSAHITDPLASFDAARRAVISFWLRLRPTQAEPPSPRRMTVPSSLMI
jgi:hypothetical protein